MVSNTFYDELADLYYDPEQGFLSANKLYAKAKKYGYTMRNIKDWLKNQETVQLNRPTTSKQEYGKIVSRHVDDIWQADLMDMQKLYKFNSNYKWLLTIIDIYSRYAWMIPLKTKSTSEVRAAMEPLLAESKLQNLTTDNGKEFTGNEMQTLLRQLNIKHWTHEPGSHNTLGVIERLNKTIRILLNKYFSAFKTRKWLDIIDSINKNYNNTYHDTIRSIPADIFEGKQQFSNQPIFSTIPPTKYKVGDIIRIKKEKGVFDKIGETYSRMTYTIISKTGNSYKVENEDGVELKRTVKSNEILKIKKTEYKTRKTEDEDAVQDELRQQKIKRQIRKDGLEPNYSTEGRQLRSYNVNQV